MNIKIKHTNIYRIRGGFNDVHNFKTFFKTFILLFQMATSAGWDGTLDAIFDDTDCKQQDSEIGRFTLAFTGTGNSSLERSNLYNMHA